MIEAGKHDSGTRDVVRPFAAFAQSLQIFERFVRHGRQASRKWWGKRATVMTSKRIPLRARCVRPETNSDAARTMRARLCGVTEASAVPLSLRALTSMKQRTPEGAR